MVMKSKPFGNKCFNVLSVTAIAGLTSVGAASVQAQDVPTLDKDSAYNIKTGTETDYTYKTTDGETDSYYKIELTKPLSSSDSIIWSDATSAGANTISVQLPHNDDSANSEIKYYTYSYSKPSNYTTATDRVTDISTVGAVDKVLFQGLNSADNGGAINNTADNSNVNITGDFIGNYTQNSSLARGGAIYNYADDSSSTAQIGNITGDFIGNYAQLTTSPYTTSVCGGAILNYGLNGTAIIGDIIGDFIGNYAQNTRGSASGSVIYNSAYGPLSISSIARIGDIIGDFIGNHAQGSSGTSGGAIYNGAAGSPSNATTAQIGNITGDFIGNYAQSTSSSAQGGAIYNWTEYGTVQIGNITGDFIGNYAQATNSSNQDGAAALGGSVYTMQWVHHRPLELAILKGIL